MPKPLFTLLSLLFIAVALPAQTPAPDTVIPPPVLQAFGRAYPDTDSVDWTIANGNTYFAYFSVGRDSLSLRFDACGNICEKAIKMRFRDLPEPLRMSFARDRYAHYQIGDVFEVNQPGGKPDRYFLIMGQTPTSLTPLRFLSNGEQISTPRPYCPCLR